MKQIFYLLFRWCSKELKSRTMQ